MTFIIRLCRLSSSQEAASKVRRKGESKKYSTRQYGVAVESGCEFEAPLGATPRPSPTGEAVARHSRAQLLRWPYRRYPERQLGVSCAPRKLFCRYAFRDVSIGARNSARDAYAAIAHAHRAGPAPAHAIFGAPPALRISAHGDGHGSLSSNDGSPRLR